MAWSRRKFLITAAAVAGGGLALTWWRSGRAPQRLSADGAVLEPNAYLQVTPAGDIILQVDKAELGQGVITGFVTLVAEELDVPPGRIHWQFAPVHPTFQDPIQLTGESMSMRRRWAVLRRTGASAREMLLAAGASAFGVPVADVESDGQGNVRQRSTGAVKSYGELAPAAAALPVPPEPVLRERAAFRYIGGHVPRPDVPGKVQGETKFGIDTRLPGMVVAVIRRPPQLRAQVRSFDVEAARRLPGVVDVVPLHTGIAVLGTSTWHAKQAAAKLTVEWEPGPLAGLDDARIRAAHATALAEGRTHRRRDDGDVEAAFSAAGDVVAAEYWVPYLAHATMEPLNATVWFHDGGCEAWVPNQGPDMVRQYICDLSGLPREHVKVHSTFAGGGFGRRATMEYVVEAASIALAVGRPVQLIWTREDDLQHGLYRETSLHRLRATLDEEGRPEAWEHRLTGAGLNRLVVPISMSVLLPEWLPARAVSGTGNAIAGALDWAVGSFSARDGSATMSYAVPNVRVDVCDCNPGVPTTIWRSVGFSYNAFVVESFVDELAERAGADPADYRRRLLAGQDRQLRVLDAVLQRARWGNPAPGRAQGVALQECFGSVIAMVAEVSVDPDGTIRVPRVTAAVDCGLAVNPDVVRQQIEGGLLFGLSAALWGEINIDDGAVRQSNFHDYRVARIADSPEIDVEILPSDLDPQGIGETGVPAIAPAIANAVYAATGQRLRALPLRLGS